MKLADLDPHYLQGTLNVGSAQNKTVFDTQSMQYNSIAIAYLCLTEAKHILNNPHSDKYGIKSYVFLGRSRGESQGKGVQTSLENYKGL